jgi:hypothetical protein
MKNTLRNIYSTTQYNFKIVYRICDDRHTTAEGIKLVTPCSSPHSFLSGGFQAAAAATPGDTGNSVFRHVM